MVEISFFEWVLNNRFIHSSIWSSDACALVRIDHKAHNLLYELGILLKFVRVIVSHFLTSMVDKISQNDFLKGFLFSRIWHWATSTTYFFLYQNWVGKKIICNDRIIELVEAGTLCKSPQPLTFPVEALPATYLIVNSVAIPCWRHRLQWYD